MADKLPSINTNTDAWLRVIHEDLLRVEKLLAPKEIVIGPPKSKKATK